VTRSTYRDAAEERGGGLELRFRHGHQIRGIWLTVAIAAQGRRRFLQQHRGQVLLVTLEYRCQRPEACSGQPSFSQLAACAVKGIPSAVTHLGTVHGPAEGRGRPGRAHRRHELLPARAGRVAQRADRPRVLDGGRSWPPTFNALSTGCTPSRDQGRGCVRRLPDLRLRDHGTNLPRNVTLLCRWTWSAPTAPAAPTSTPNQAGYKVIAQEFLRAADLSCHPVRG